MSSFFIYGDLIKSCASDFYRAKVIITLLDSQSKEINKLNAHVSYGKNSSRYSTKGSFYVHVNFDPRVVSASIDVQW